MASMFLLHWLARRLTSTGRWLAGVGGGLLLALALAQAQAPLPALTARVLDHSGTLSAAQSRCWRR